jgi:hypothetical protein
VVRSAHNPGYPAADAQLSQSAIVDTIVSDEQLDLFRRPADQFAARLSLIECVCSDQSVHRARICGRTRGIPGWHEVGWDHVERMRAEATPLTAERLIIDAIQPADQNFSAVLAYLGL